MAVKRKTLKEQIAWVTDTIRSVRPDWTKPPETPKAGDILDQLQQRITFGLLMDSLNQSPAFKQFIELHERRYKEIDALLRTCEVPDGVARNVIRLQAQLEELESILNVVPEAIQDGIKAQESRSELIDDLRKEERDNV